jgi:hypothetical protein
VWELLEYRTLHVYEIFIDHKKSDLCEAVSEFKTKTPKIVCALEKLQLWRRIMTLSFKSYLGYDFEWFESFPRYEMRLLLVVFLTAAPPYNRVAYIVNAFVTFFSFDLGIYVSFICLFFVNFVEMCTQICVLHHFALIYLSLLHPDTFNLFTVLHS